MNKKHVFLSAVLVCAGAAEAQTFVLGGQPPPPQQALPQQVVPQTLPPTPTLTASAQDYNPISVMVRRGSLKANLNRIVGELGWSRFFPATTKDAFVAETYTLELLPSEKPVSPEYMRDVVRTILVSIQDHDLKPLFYVKDKVVVLTEKHE